MKIKTLRVITAAALFAAALPASAFGSLGSIISSFWVADNWWSYAFGVARDATYIYWVTTERAPYHLYYRNPGGGGGGSVFIGTFPAGHADADASVLGPGYFADIYREGTSGPFSITDFDIHTGSAVASWARFNDIQGYAYNPARRIRYVGNKNGYVYRYNAAGSLLGSFPAPEGISGLAATNEFAGSRGEYIIVTKAHYWYVFTAQGVEIARVRFPWEFGSIGESACGPGYPSEYGTTLWCIALDKDYDSYVCQISLHNATALTPASVGKIKALFR
jgi:hypothetical protein